MANSLISTPWLKCGLMATAIVALTACDQFGAGTDATDDGASAAAPLLGGSTEDRDIEAPEIFQKAESGLWDGRPSLGGVWVAHPDVTDPERVIIRNETNGKFVIGALFRRERDNPGPALQVSSDAAQELGMLAGSPAALNVVALRREAVEVTPPATTDFDAPVDVTAVSLDDPIAAAEAAVATAEAALPTPVVQTPVAAAVAIPAPAASAPQPTSSLEKPFIQIGIFSVEENANDTATTLRNDGMSASVLAQNSQGKPFWRVIVGPAPTSADRAAILQKVQSLGFADAYFVTN